MMEEQMKKLVELMSGLKSKQEMWTQEIKAQICSSELRISNKFKEIFSDVVTVKEINTVNVDMDKVYESESFYTHGRSTSKQEVVNVKPLLVCDLPVAEEEANSASNVKLRKPETETRTAKSKRKNKSKSSGTRRKTKAKREKENLKPVLVLPVVGKKEGNRASNVEPCKMETKPLKEVVDQSFNNNRERQVLKRKVEETAKNGSGSNGKKHKYTTKYEELKKKRECTRKTTRFKIKGQSKRSSSKRCKFGHEQKNDREWYFMTKQYIGYKHVISEIPFRQIRYCNRYMQKINEYFNRGRQSKPKELYVIRKRSLLGTSRPMRGAMLQDLKYHY